MSKEYFKPTPTSTLLRSLIVLSGKRESVAAAEAAIRAAVEAHGKAGVAALQLLAMESGKLSDIVE